MKSIGLASLWTCVLVLAACQAPPPPAAPDHRADAEAAVHDAVKEWVAAAEAKDPEKFASFYADDAVLMMENAPDVRGGQALREAVAGMMSDPAFSLTFAADQVVAARSGDLAYETGSYTLTFSDPDGKPVTQIGHYVDVWRKQADGSWKVVVDAPVSDPPAEPGATGEN